MTTDERHPITGAPILLVADGGVRVDLPPPGDPIAAWVDLMEAVEALSGGKPFPQRASRVGWVYRL